MIVVLCPSFYEAQADFEIFLKMMIDEYGEESVVDASRASYYVDTDDDLRYIFVDYRYEPLFRKMNGPIDIVKSDEFFDDLIYRSNSNWSFMDFV